MTANNRAWRPRALCQDRFGIGALALYSAISIALIGRGLFGHFADHYIGKSADPSVYMWFLVWWPHAIAHHLNPFITKALWAPAGFNVTWTTGLPLAALIAAPITAGFGPVVSYNVLCIAAPILASWACFLLCRQITANYWPALAGGYVYGFSAYMLAESRAHLVLILVFPVPIMVSLALMRLRERIGVVTFAALLAGIIAAEFLFSLELCATTAFFGAIAIVLGLAFTGGEARVRIWRLVPPILASYAAAAALMLPYLYFFFQPGFPPNPVNSPTTYSSDLANFIIPTAVNQIGGTGLLKMITRRFPSNHFEAGAYFGIPLIVVALLFTRSRWREPAGKLLAVFLVIVCILTLGPRLHIAGVTLFGMPWKIAGWLPVIRNALPSRFAMYAFLDLAIMLSIWLSSGRIGVAAKIAAVALIGIFSCPNLSATFWVSHADIPAFFSGGEYRTWLRPNENVLVLPYGFSGNSMLWQAEAAMYFRMPGGWTSITPREFERWPIVDALLFGTHIPDAAMQLRAFMAAHQTGAVIVNNGALPLWAPILAGIDPAPRHIGGISLYRLPQSEFAAYRDADVIELERSNNEKRFAALLSAAQAWLTEGGNPAALTPMHMQQLGLLPPHWVSEPDVRTRNGLYLGPWEDGRIAVGVVGSYEALQPLIALYREDAAKILFPYPTELADKPKGDTFLRLLVMVFDRSALARAAATVHRPLPPATPALVSDHRGEDKE